MLLHQLLLQQRLKPHPQRHQIVVERYCNRDSITSGLGRTPEEAAQKVLENARAYGYWDATNAYPQGNAPEPGSSRDDL